MKCHSTDDQMFSCAQSAINHNVGVRDEQKEPERGQAEIELDKAKAKAKAWDIIVRNKNQKANQDSHHSPKKHELYDIRFSPHKQN